MASKAGNIPSFDFSPDLNAKKIEIQNAGYPNQVPKPDLDDDRKRWLVVGICLNDVISPTLRQYVDPKVTQAYNAAKTNYNIHTQVHPNYLKNYPPTKTHLNYEAVNQNKISHSYNRNMYDYKIMDAVEFSKLFLQPSMAKYSGFNHSCDLSALTGMMVNVDTFPQQVKHDAEQIRSYVRNDWAHCDFSQWTKIKYMACFRLMYQLIKNLGLTIADEKDALDRLTKWEQSGLSFLHGTTLGLELVKEFRDKTSALVEYANMIVFESESTFTQVHTELCKIDNLFESVSQRVDQLEEEQMQQRSVINTLNAGTQHLTDAIDNAKQNIESNLEYTKILDARQTEAAAKVESLDTEYIYIRERQEKAEQTISTTQKEITDIKEDIQEIKLTESRDRSQNKVFFFPPNRVQYFVGREYELNKLKRIFFENVNESFSQAISGLGGCGKTALAIEFAWLYQDLYPGGIFWMSAESCEIMENAISKLAIYVSTVGKNSSETLHTTLKWLSMLEEKWLLVLDNVDEDMLSGNIKEMIMGSWKRKCLGHFVYTSRREPAEIEESFNINPDNCIYLDSFTETEAFTFLKKRTNRVSHDDDNHIVELVTELGGLPLALEQAGAHIKALKCSFEQYTNRFTKKRLKLLRPIRDKSTHPIQKDRLAVTTTWQLNIDYIQKQSEEEDLGTTALTVMKIVSFLYADDIPIEIINQGSPEIDAEDLNDALQDELGVKQIVEILTKFSLFQMYGENTLSVHRLVQEVIRDGIQNTKQILQYTGKMIHKALQCTTSPFTALVTTQNERDMRGSLCLWGKLAANASVFKTHLKNYPDYIRSDSALLFSEEMCKIIQTSSIYHSVNQRQDEALADQDQMLHIMTTLNLQEDTVKQLTSVKIPLLEKDRLRIQDCIATLSCEKQPEDTCNTLAPIGVDQLRILGNEAFKENRKQEAIQYYSEGIRGSSEKTLDYRLLSNRSLLYLKMKNYEHALVDAQKCIELAPSFWKAYCWKAYAIANLIKIEDLPSEMESAGLASACIAANLNPKVLVEYKMKINYPVINSRILTDNEDLGNAIRELTDRPYTTLMLRKGKYILKEGSFTPKSLQIIGIEDGCSIDTDLGLGIAPVPKEAYTIEFRREERISIHFENVYFTASGGQITVAKNAVATFFKCKFSNGKKGCDKFPDCNGGKGCVIPSGCNQQEDLSVLGDTKSGEIGYPGLCITKGGTAYINTCIFERCGGGAVLSVGDGSFVDIRKSTLSKNRQMGLEAREGGKLNAVDNVIVDNQSHGVAIGQRGFGILQGNFIQNNQQEGVLCCGYAENTAALCYIPTDTSEAVIIDNIICHNGLCGISVDGGVCDMSGNKILDNWLWGIMVKSQSSASISDNDIFENKCGGIRIGINYAASVYIDGNTIRDHHSGPSIHTLGYDFSLPAPSSLLSNTNQVYSKPTLVTNRNIFQNNDKGVIHPQTIAQIMKACGFCKIGKRNLQNCSRCRKASYCSKECQTKHWNHHKQICNLICQSYIVRIKMSETQQFKTFTENTKGGHITSLSFIADRALKGVGKCPKTDRTKSKLFVVKIQSVHEYRHYNPNKTIMLYDKSLSLHIVFTNPQLYHILHECGVLVGEKFTIKAIFCNASFEEGGKTLCVYTDNLPPFDTSW